MYIHFSGIQYWLWIWSDHVNELDNCYNAAKFQCWVPLTYNSTIHILNLHANCGKIHLNKEVYSLFFLLFPSKEYKHGIFLYAWTMSITLRILLLFKDTKKPLWGLIDQIHDHHYLCSLFKWLFMVLIEQISHDWKRNFGEWSNDIQSSPQQPWMQSQHSTLRSQVLGRRQVRPCRYRNSWASARPLRKGKTEKLWAVTG